MRSSAFLAGETFPWEVGLEIGSNSWPSSTFIHGKRTWELIPLPWDWDFFPWNNFAVGASTVSVGVEPHLQNNWCSSTWGAATLIAWAQNGWSWGHFAKRRNYCHLTHAMVMFFCVFWGKLPSKQTWKITRISSFPWRIQSQASRVGWDVKSD